MRTFILSLLLTLALGVLLLSAMPPGLLRILAGLGVALVARFAIEQFVTGEDEEDAD